MYTRVYVYKPAGMYMSGKLYWRVKRKDGKWTWTPAVIDVWSSDSIMLLRLSQTTIDGDLIFPEEEE